MGLGVRLYTIRHEEEALWRHLSKFAHPSDGMDCNIKPRTIPVFCWIQVLQLSSLLIGNSLPSMPSGMDVGNQSGD
jgi:hypothetical protein